MNWNPIIRPASRWAGRVLGLACLVAFFACTGPAAPRQELPDFPIYEPGIKFLQEQDRNRTRARLIRVHQESSKRLNLRRAFEKTYVEWEPIHRRILVAREAARRNSLAGLDR